MDIGNIESLNIDESYIVYYNDREVFMIEANIAPIMAAVMSAAAAAAAKRKMDKEEKMATYKSDDLDGWEFKIVRAYTRKFKNRETIEQVCREEAVAGWELVEKFDDYRLRFKRRVERRSMDEHLEQNPYRSAIGSPAAGIIVTIVATILVALGIFLFIGFGRGFDRGILGGVTVSGIILGLIVLIAIGCVIAVIFRNR